MHRGWPRRCDHRRTDLRRLSLRLLTAMGNTHLWSMRLNMVTCALPEWPSRTHPGCPQSPGGGSRSLQSEVRRMIHILLVDFGGRRTGHFSRDHPGIKGQPAAVFEIVLERCLSGKGIVAPTPTTLHCIDESSDRPKWASPNMPTSALRNGKLSNNNTNSSFIRCVSSSSSSMPDHIVAERGVTDDGRFVAEAASGQQAQRRPEPSWQP